MHHIFLLGGSGQTGGHFIDEALKRGHQITALVRNLDSVKARPNLNLVKGTPYEEADIKAAFQSVSPNTPITAVVSALGNSLSSGNFLFAKVINPPDVLEKSIGNTIRVMAAQSPPVRKFVFLSSFGAGDGRQHISIVVRQVVNWTNLSVGFDDHDKVDAMFKTGVGKDLDWTLVRAASLNNGPAKPIKEVGEVPIGVGMKQISRHSTAVFMVDALEKSDWIHRTPVIIES